MNVEAAADQKSAVVYLTALASGVGKDWNQAQELKLSLIKLEGNWEITAAETVETLTLDQ